MELSIHHVELGPITHDGVLVEHFCANPYFMRALQNIQRKIQGCDLNRFRDLEDLRESGFQITVWDAFLPLQQIGQCGGCGCAYASAMQNDVIELMVAAKLAADSGNSKLNKMAHVASFFITFKQSA